MQTPNRRALILRTPMRKDPEFMETAMSDDLANKVWTVNPLKGRLVPQMYSRPASLENCWGADLDGGCSMYLSIYLSIHQSIYLST